MLGLSAYSTMVNSHYYGPAKFMRRANAGAEFNIVRKAASLMGAYSFLAGGVGIFKG